MSGNVLVIGSGGREHAIVWKLAQSGLVKRIFAAPGSSAIEQVEKTELVGINIKDFEQVSLWCVSTKIDLVIVGPEDPLANGIADVLTSKGIKVFGPSKNGAQIESDKNWSKDFMDRHGIPTAKWKSFTDAREAKDFINKADFPALVVKASGLAAGKGVVVAKDNQEACEAIDSILVDKKFGNAGEVVVVEELLQGEEVSILAFSDGYTVKPMLPAQDHKRIFDNDQGPNTGGMGAYCPCPLISRNQYDYIEREILQPTVKGLRKDGIKYIGVLYCGLMLTPNGPKVLEFNCRFGDPETEVILPLLESDLYEIMLACCNGTLSTVELQWKSNVSAVGVVMASRGYPETSSKGQIISGVEEVHKLKDHVVFHCGTTMKEGNLLTNGGRVLIVVNLAPKLTLAAAHATRACNIIKFDGAQYRRDIAHKGISRDILVAGQLTYKSSGVDIVAGDSLVNRIKPIAKSTNRAGVLGGLGGFGGLFDTKAAGFKDPILVSGTDGVGTKLKIAQEIGVHNSIGIDLVAMCVNDILAHGAEPLFFLDYFACGKLEVEVAQQVVSGIGQGCKQAGCSLIGGETAEMPDMYAPGEYDLAGFAVGAVERNSLLPRMQDIEARDVIVALPSSGVHSNGFSLVRKVMQLAQVDYRTVAPFSKQGRTFGQEFLTPTEIYVNAMKPVIRMGKMKAFAHITGGGLTENIPRVLSDSLAVKLDAKKWIIPPVFGWLAALGDISQAEMLCTFNCGVGAVLIVAKNDVSAVLKEISTYGATVIGEVITKHTGDKQVQVCNFPESMERLMRPFVPTIVSRHMKPKKRVAVLISGSGTNLQALIDATRDPSQHLNSEIVVVVSNKPNVEGLNRAKRANIETKVIGHVGFKNREEYDGVVHAVLEEFSVDIVCLAGFMRILSGEFTRTWKGRLLNIHPSLLPSFKGGHAVRDALEAGVRITGCSVHFVEENVDSGAVIVQEAVPIQWNDTEETLLERLHIAEHRAFPKALKLLATEQVKLGENNKLIWSK